MRRVGGLLSTTLVVLFSGFQVVVAEEGSIETFIWEGYPDKIQARLEARDRRAMRVPNQGTFQPFSLLVETLKKWNPGQTVTVAFRDGGNADLHGKIAAKAREWLKFGNLTLDFGFDPATNRYRQWSTSDQDYAADIRIGFSGNGYWSLVGTDSRNPEIVAPNRASINLQGFSAQLPINWKTTVIHEFGHALGAHHEHQHPSQGCDNEFRWDDDEGYVETTDSFGQYTEDTTGKKPGIYTVLGGEPNNWPKSKIDHNLRQLKNSKAFTFGPFDVDSIMKYYFPAWMFVNGTESQCYNGTENTVLSANDKNEFQNIYPYVSSAVSTILIERKNFLDLILKLENLSQSQKSAFQFQLLQIEKF